MLEKTEERGRGGKQQGGSVEEPLAARSTS